MQLKAPINYIDISPMITPSIAVFPGDTPYRRDIKMDMDKDDEYTLSSIDTTVHLGAHVDAPNHYDKKGGGDRPPRFKLLYGGLVR